MSDAIQHTPDISVADIPPGFFNKAYGMLDDMFKEFMQGMSEGLINGLQPVLLTALTIYFMCKAWSMMFGTSQGSLKELTMQCIKIVFIAELFCNAPNFYEFCIKGIFYLDEFFVNIARKAPGLHLDKDVQNPFNAIDSVYYGVLGKAQDALTYYMEGMDSVTGLLHLTSLPGTLVNAILLFIMVIWFELCVVIATFIAFMILVTNTFGLAFLLATGPFFGCLAMFPQTKHLFQSWLKACLNLVLTKVFIAFGCFMMIYLAKNFFDTFVDKQVVNMLVAQQQGDPVEKAASLLSGDVSNILSVGIRFIFLSLIYLCFGFIFAKCPKIATSLVGGLEFNHGLQNAKNVASAAYNTYDVATRGLPGGAAKGLSGIIRTAAAQPQKAVQWLLRGIMGGGSGARPGGGSGPSKGGSGHP